MDFDSSLICGVMKLAQSFSAGLGEYDRYNKILKFIQDPPYGNDKPAGSNDQDRCEGQARAGPAKQAGHVVAVRVLEPDRDGIERAGNPVGLFSDDYRGLARIANMNKQELGRYVRARVPALHHRAWGFCVQITYAERMHFFLDLNLELAFQDIDKQISWMEMRRADETCRYRDVPYDDCLAISALQSTFMQRFHHHLRLGLRCLSIQAERRAERQYAS